MISEIIDGVNETDIVPFDPALVTQIIVIFFLLRNTPSNIIAIDAKLISHKRLRVSAIQQEI